MERLLLAEFQLEPLHCHIHHLAGGVRVCIYASMGRPHPAVENRPETTIQEALRAAMLASGSSVSKVQVNSIWQRAQEFMED